MKYIKYMDQYLIYKLNEQNFAIPLQVVARVVQTVAVRPLAHNCPHVVGVIDLQGSIISVVNIRSLLDLPTKEMELTDYLLICAFEGKRFALLIDAIENTEYCERQEGDASAIPFPDALDHLIKYKDETIPVYQLEKIFKKFGVTSEASTTG
jgi:purine-binding chemotaxis protein CheW